ncbi:DNA helicase-2/ATP-dependent DNA helicase PcrA [Paenibacillus taihuensis]|uniref:DNA helicase-2/ATP-dependent DNA helicase PcrA n=1 Tax=Paenibacillus taihuensis TaxID=1156355 RepID=A0A3D9Q3F4_9BACL|nr:RNA polymerase recycling motor HelD [Paenibacillus taihuensis]REE56306.1 DNA helicase-2/ATP-dependent DNA helicase PcrA [Paenibacillus taihuensis]
MISENDWKQEQARLNEVTGTLQAKIAELEPEVSGLRNQVTDFRKKFWEDVTVNTSTFDDFEETLYSIRQQEALLNERERSHRARLQRYNNMKRMLPSPYFGRIDYEEKVLGLSEQIYIGVSSLVDEDGLSFLVYDWRTPIASMYYDHSPGPASYATPGGQIDGEMLLKRQYQIRDGELRSVFDTSVTIGDELLQQALGKGADAQMKSIVATIQKEQNAIIRDDQNRMLIVQGAAGSGKTSAALQRAAYLLYKHRDRLRADQIVLFSPNPMFNSYVSTVLPELGEENMQQTTFQEYLAHWLGSSMQLEDPFDQIEYVLTAAGDGSSAYEARLQGIRYKASESFLRALQHYATWLCMKGMQFSGIRYRDREIISAEQMAAQFYSYDSSIRLANRALLLRDWLLEQLTTLERAERAADWVQDDLDYLDVEQYEEAHKAVLKKYERDEAVFDFTQSYIDQYGDFRGTEAGEGNAFDFADQEEELLRRTIVKASFEPLRREVRRFKFIDFVRLYGQLFSKEEAYEYAEMTGTAEVPEKWAEICEQTLAKLDASELFYEDATPYLYLKELVEGVRTNTDVRHVFVDEGQDYSPFQYAFLKQLFPRARMTVLGDFGQAIFVQSTNLHEAGSPLARIYGADETRLIRLVRSYRSTLEIVELTKAMLPGGTDIVPFERRGGKPQLVQLGGSEVRAGRIASDLAELRAEGFDSIAVITKTAAEAREAHAALAGAAASDGLRLITKETLTFEKGVAVIPAYLAKGVEFDAVLVYDASAATYSRESERKLFYTVCTRAMHRLRLYSVGDVTPYMGELNASLYEVSGS